MKGGRNDKIILFRFAIDLDHVFGFCEDYDKVMYGYIHTHGGGGGGGRII